MLEPPNGASPRRSESLNEAPVDPPADAIASGSGSRASPGLKLLKQRAQRKVNIDPPSGKEQICLLRK